MCAASDSNASDCATTPTTTSPAMNTTIKASAMLNFRRSVSWPTPCPWPCPCPCPAALLTAVILTNHCYMRILDALTEIRAGIAVSTACLARRAATPGALVAAVPPRASPLESVPAQHRRASPRTSRQSDHLVRRRDVGGRRLRDSRRSTPRRAGRSRRRRLLLLSASASYLSPALPCRARSARSNAARTGNPSPPVDSG